MIVRFDATGQAMADTMAESFAFKALVRKCDVHVSNMLVINWLRTFLRRMPVAERPQVTWVFEGRTVHFDNDLRSRDAWDVDSTNCWDRALEGLW